MLQRRQELQNLQSANGGNNPQLTRAEFPKPANDLTFIQRTQNDAAGYAPYAGKSAYETLNLDAVVKEQNEIVKQRQNAYCNNAPQMLATLNADLATLEKCKTENVAFETCLTKLQGVYY